MEEPDFTDFRPRRLITMTMQDKYTAVCFIYDGVHYQNLCRYKNPDGSYNYSENCLAKLPHYTAPFIGALKDLNETSQPSSEHGLVRYEDRQQSPMPPFNTFLTHYWLPIIFGILMIILLTLLLAIFVWPVFKKKNKGPKMARLDDSGSISLGKISYYPTQVLGIGSRGTVVYRGTFEKYQECAIKRVVSQCLTLADREVDFLRSLQHPNLVRYLATEIDPQFIYIALELAEYTLRFVIENEKLSETGLTREEICRHSAVGLQHLHKLDIVHRDIKPENILISFSKRPDKERSVMISDFGLSKQLSNDNIHSSGLTKYFDGTQGWTAPEILKAREKSENLIPSKEADIFSLGCVFYYIVFGGKHPFGENALMQENIINNKSFYNEFIKRDHSHLKKELVVMCDYLVRSMIEPTPEKRPPISSVLRFPMFWSKKEQLQFLSEVSDRLDSDKADKKQKVYSDNDKKFTIKKQPKIEYRRNKVTGGNWKDRLSTSLCNDIEGKENQTKYRNYDGNKLQDLLRVIRNKRHHYNDCSEALKLELGEIPDQFIDYFNSRFPELLIYVYDALQVYRSEPKFRDYYDQEADYFY